MGSLNKAMIIGHLGADPEVRYTQNNTAVANMRVATNDRYRDSNGELQETTEWHRIVAWGRLAENCQQLLAGQTPAAVMKRRASRNYRSMMVMITHRMMGLTRMMTSRSEVCQDFTC
jgi:single-stranded DNA-binding protein